MLPGLLSPLYIWEMEYKAKVPFLRSQGKHVAAPGTGHISRAPVNSFNPEDHSLFIRSRSALFQTAVNYLGAILRFREVTEELK